MDFLSIGKRVLTIEADAIRVAAERLDGSFEAAVKLLKDHKGKVIVCGMGKSGHIAQKIAATLSSTGTPAVFLHPAEGLHGDLGIYNPGDPTLLLSKSGTTEEMLRLMPILKQFHSPILAILGNVNSTIGRHADVVIDASVEREADTLNLAPTTSTTLMLALGDALASALMHEKGFTEKDFAIFHPGGQLGRNLLRVEDVMQTRDRVACISQDTSLRETVIAMTERNLGAACVLSGNNTLLGIITDGDIRRFLRREGDLNTARARDLMCSHPTCIEPQDPVGLAIEKMENRPQNNQLSHLPVVDKNNTFCGLIRLHDAYLG